jgi:hypothetical protein
MIEWKGTSDGTIECHFSGLIPKGDYYWVDHTCGIIISRAYIYPKDRPNQGEQL